MADNLTDEIERLVLDWLLTDATVTRPVLPLEIRLMEAAGDDSASGVELAGDLYDPVDVTFDPSQTVLGVTSSAPATPVTIAGLDSTLDKTVVGVEVWDAGVVPRRIARGAFSQPLLIPAGEPLVFNLGQLAFRLG